jgi:hypothetical protein
VPLDSMRRYVTHLSVMILSLFHVVSFTRWHLFLSDSPHDHYSLWMHTRKGSQKVKQLGPVRSTEVTIPCRILF